MINPPSSLLETYDHSGHGYQPLIDSGEWRVARLNFTPGEQVLEFQRHDETDEVFVLLQGRCILLLGEGAEQVTRIYAQEMQPFRLYNVRRGTWHARVLSADAKVLIVENRDTTAANSPKIPLNLSQQEEVASIVRQIWGE